MANPWFRFYSEFEDDPKVLMMPEPMQLRLVKVFCSRSKEVVLTDAQRAFKPALFQQSGRPGVRSDKLHDLCRACVTAWRNRLRNIDGQGAAGRKDSAQLFSGREPRE
jgi:hypothetical protein